jgi:methionine sulfoxide reductase heme-binding subunit
VNHDLYLWYSARVAAMTALAVLSASVLTGIAIRTAYLAPIARNRAVTAVHSFLSWFWVPLVFVHVGALVLDSTGGIHLVDTVVPFQVPYASTAIGLGTISFLLLVVTLVTSLARKHLPVRLWRWLHRLTYPMLALMVIHAQLAGTDFSHIAVSVLAWAVAGSTLLLALPRLAHGRMATETAPASAGAAAGTGD